MGSKLHLTSTSLADRVGRFNSLRQKSHYMFFRIITPAFSSSCLVILLFFLSLSGCGRNLADLRSPANKMPVKPISAALFQDVTEQAGIHFVHKNGVQADRPHFPETTPAGCAFLDYDNDGWLDILLIQSGDLEPEGHYSRPHCALYHNNGNGTFTDVTAGSGLDKDLGYGQGVAIGDYDNDGYEDVFITAYNGNHLFHNEKGSGKFTDVTAKMGLDRVHSTGYATSAAFGDYDNDGKLDLYVCYYCPWTPLTDKACFNSQHQRDYCSPEVYPVDTHVLYHNEGNRFVDVSAKSGIDKVRGRGLAVAFVDYDEDGKQDIFVANDLSGNMLWHNEGHGKFIEKGMEAGCRYGSGGTLMAGMGVAVGDYDQSGHDSLYVSNFEEMPNMLFKNSGKGFMEDMTIPSHVGALHMPYLSFGCEFLDYDADGWPDILTANGHVQMRGKSIAAMKESKQLLHNERDATFREISDLTELGGLHHPTIARGLAVGDFDNDGRLDALFSNQNDVPQLFRNMDRSQHHWVSFKTIGTQSNRDGLHTHFTLTAAGRKRYATVRAGSSYLSMSDRRVYFGLGDATKIDKVEVSWPSGSHDLLTGVAMDQSYVVTEGKGITARLPHAPSGSNVPKSLLSR